MSACSFTFACSGLINAAFSSSSTIMPTLPWSQGRMVSFMPSSSSPAGSRTWAPCPLNAKKRESPATPPAARACACHSMFWRVGQAAGWGAESRRRVTSSKAKRVRSRYSKHRASFSHPDRAADVPA